MRFISLGAFLCLSHFVFAQQESIALPLDADWQFFEKGGSDTLPATVPGSVHLDLLKNGKIEDPFFGTNENDCQWVEGKDWTYITTFALDSTVLGMEGIELDFNGLDTYAKVFLNDKLILKADNMFRSWNVNAKPYLRMTNKLRVEFRSAVDEHRLQVDSAFLPAPSDASEIPVSPYVRKAPYQFGWDWAPRLVGCGIWRPIELKAYNGPAIRQVHVKADSSGKVKLNIELYALKEEVIWLKMIADTIRDSLRIMVSPGQNSIRHSLQITDPALWWPVGHGDQKTYPLKVVVEGKTGRVESEKRFAFRTVELLQENDAIGREFTFKINGRKIYMKGANMVPLGMFPSQETPEKIEQLLDDVLAANMNMVRLWGGGLYGSDKFYELCDQKGIMVWQDFPFACSMYPGTEAFRKNVKQEIAENVKHLKDHPSLVIWCGNNEVDVAWNNWGWQEQYAINSTDSTRIVDDNIFLFDTLIPHTLREFDQRTPYISSSPQSNWGKPDNFNFGNMHYWGVWHGEERIDEFGQNVGRFMSEYGMQSYPNWRTIEGYTLPEDREFGSTVFEHHQKSYKGDRLIKEMVQDRYGKPKDAKALVHLSQILQAEAMSIAIDAHRLSHPHCMGSTYWQLNDVWPGPSWSTIDHSGEWKAAHYAVRDAFKPTVLLYELDKNSIRISINNELPLKGEAQVVLKDFAPNGTQKEFPVSLDFSGTKQLLVLNLEETFGKKAFQNAPVSLELWQQNQRLDKSIIFTLEDKKRHDAPKIDLDVTQISGGFELILHSTAFVPWVMLEADKPGRFTNNYFHLLAGENVRVQFVPQEKTNEVTFSVLGIESLLD